jgi:membrane protease YdiL (CAAX protease family)
MPDSRGPTPIFFQAADGVFPGPFAAIFLTLAALFGTAFVTAILYGALPLMAAAGIGQVIGMGGVAALATRRVPGPHDVRIGLRGFAPQLLVALACLLPIVIVVSEIDNYVRILLDALQTRFDVLAPPSPEMLERREQIARLLEVDSVYAAVQKVIVAVGIGPVIEGFFFFGVLLQGIVARIGPARGILLTALLYSIVHFPASGAPGDAIVPLASALITGALLALARLGTGSVLAAMVLAGAIAALHIAAAEGADYVAIAGFNAPGEHSSPWIVVPSVVAVLYGTWTLWHRTLGADPPPPVEDAERDDG